MRNSLRLLKVTLLVLIISSLSIGSIISAGTSINQEDSSFLNNVEQKRLVEELHKLSGGKLRISTHSKTGKVRFLGTDFNHTISQFALSVNKLRPEDASRKFLTIYGSLFGLKNPDEELKVTRTKTVKGKRSFVRFQQLYSGIPILGGELIVQMDSSNRIISVNGEILPDININTSPRVKAKEAQRKTLDVISKVYSKKFNIKKDSLQITKPELWIYNPILLGINGGLTHLVWRMEVTSRILLPIKELVLIDAHLGNVALHFNQIDTARYRLIYDHNNTPGKPLPGETEDLKRVEGQSSTGITDVDNAYDYSGDTYDFYWNYHGRDSVDNAGMELISTTRYSPDGNPYSNAFWTGSQMVYGEGFAVDDVAGHEITHGVTEYESHLFYYMQSGAINEAFSDIWGEFIDLTNGEGNDSSSVRWLLGEDLSIGAIRNMKNPPDYGAPDRMGSPNYACGTCDNGGVHINSGVANKTAYLLTDGDTFNGYTVTGLGIEKTASLFYEVQTNLLTSASDYQDLYDALLQAAINLGFDSYIQEVENAVNATEMNQQPASCPAPEAPLCDTGVPVDLFFDNLEDPSSGNWTHGAITGADEWYYPQIDNPYGFDATYATSGQYNFWGYNQWDVADIYMAMTFDVSLPQNTTAYMHFQHSYWFEFFDSEYYDGGVIEYSTDGGLTWNDAGSLITHNGYTGTIGEDYENPLGGREAFCGISNGYISTRLDLGTLAGQDVRFRFRIGTDSRGDAYGWFIDDIRIYTCTSGYSISGQVTLEGGTGTVTDVSLTLSGDALETTHPDSTGNYSFTELKSGNYTITPSLSGYVFVPSSRSYQLLEVDQIDQNFTGMYVEPVLNVTPTSLDFGKTATQHILDITNTGKGELIWSIESDKRWISVSPESGSTTTEVDSVTVTVDRAVASSGNRTATVNINSNGGNKSVSVSIISVRPPQIVYPDNGEADIALDPVLRIDTDYNAVKDEFNLVAIRWQIFDSDERTVFDNYSSIDNKEIKIPLCVLKSEETYSWRAGVVGLDGYTHWAEKVQFTTSKIEDFLTENEDITEITGEIVSDTGVVTQAYMQDIDSLSDVPSNYNFYNDVFSFRIDTRPDTGLEVQVTFQLDKPFQQGDKWFKYYPDARGWDDTYGENITDGIGTRQVTLKFKDGDYGDVDGIANGIIVDPSGPAYTLEEEKEEKDKGGGGSDCFIATAAYGTPMHEEVQILQQFRDEYLLRNPFGKALIHTYYKISPLIAEFMNKYPALKRPARFLLGPVIWINRRLLERGEDEKR
ncbi:MAG TPA: hypothetical protein EYP78_02655 [Candidatus Omnitrophica bacterium]|nr:hypothetical protein [Candidatus Omnitrophota bacterium]